MPSSQSELQVITFAKNLCSYVMTITQKSPKQFRFSLVGRMQGYVMDIVEELYFANEVFIRPGANGAWKTRVEHQRKAMSRLKLLTYSRLRTCDYDTCKKREPPPGPVTVR